MSTFVVLFAAYIIGSIPSGLIIGKKAYGVDLRQMGSKNIGATNAYRILGRRPAFLVFMADALKGVVGVLIGQIAIEGTMGMIAGGIFAIIGHNWSIFLKFKGGRGVATGLGVLAMLTPAVTAIVFIIWLLIVYVTKYVSLASIIAAMVVPIFMRIFACDLDTIVFGIIAAFFVIIRHKPNIERLYRGEEPKIKAGSKKN